MVKTIRNALSTPNTQTPCITNAPFHRISRTLLSNLEMHFVVNSPYLCSIKSDSYMHIKSNILNTIPELYAAKSVGK